MKKLFAAKNGENAVNISCTEIIQRGGLVNENGTWKQ